jgi:hypothetical protein
MTATNYEDGFTIDSTFAIAPLVVGEMIYFAFLSASSCHPVTILSTPDKAILALNLASAGCAFLIRAELLGTNDITSVDYGYTTGWYWIRYIPHITRESNILFWDMGLPIL